jgi:hypothetical protein
MNGSQRFRFTTTSDTKIIEFQCAAFESKACASRVLSVANFAREDPMVAHRRKFKERDVRYHRKLSIKAQATSDNIEN